MRKLVSALYIVSFCMLTVYADDYYWGNNEGGWWGNYSVNWSDENHVQKDHQPYANDNAIFDVNFMKYKVYASISTSGETIKDLIFQNHYTETDGVKTSYGFTVYADNKTNPTLTVTGNIIKYRGESEGDTVIKSRDFDNRFTLVVSGNESDSSSGNIIMGAASDNQSLSGNLSLGEYSLATALEKLIIAKDVNLYWNSTISFNVGSNNGTIENPDAVIGGIVNFNGGNGYNPLWVLLACSDGNELNTVVQTGGLKGNGITRVNKETKGSATLVFANAAGVSCVYNGYLLSESAGAKLKVVMNGEGTQSLLPIWEPDKYFTFSGLEVRKGTMEIFSVLSVGDIELTGGTLKVSGVTAHYSTDPGSSSSQKAAQLHGENLIWTSGKVLVNVIMNDEGNAEASMIYLTGALKKGDGFSKAEFEFSGEILFYLDEWIQIMSFEQGAEDFDASDFVANTFDNEWGAKFKIDNNALYVMYTAIPEPAAAAAVLGIFAVAVMLVRKNLLKKTNQLF